ncbi:MAG: triose-phosphate isomerase [Caulobacteraceae bacterium]
MPATPRKFIVGNWKMNGLAEALDDARRLADALSAEPTHARVALCPPATLIERMARRLAGSAVEIGGQDCHAEPGGAFTGDISAEMLKDAGARLVILGHSERRDRHGETDADVAAKVVAALRAGLEPIVCVGETLEQRKAGQAEAVVRGQLEGSLPPDLKGKVFAVAYEPVWAIGSGLTPTIEEIEAIHAEVRSALVRFGADAATPILYGGSVKPANAAEILRAAEVGGALVGGASLKSAEFLPIVRAAYASPPIAGR